MTGVVKCFADGIAVSNAADRPPAPSKRIGKIVRTLRNARAPVHFVYKFNGTSAYGTSGVVALTFVVRNHPSDERLP